MRSLLIGATSVALIALAFHIVARWSMLRYGLRMGAVSHKLAPLYAYWSPRFKGWLLIPTLALGVYAWSIRRTGIARDLAPPLDVAYFVAALLVVSVSVGMMDKGPRGLVEPYRRTSLEYFGGVTRVDSPTEFMRTYASRIDEMPMHAQVHPPGAILFLWVWGGGVGVATAGSVSVSAFLVVPIYVLARQLGGERTSRCACLLATVTPSVVLFTATSMDGVFAVPLLASIAVFWKGLHNRAWYWAAASGLLMAIASLLTYSVAIAGLWCLLAATIRLVNAESRARAASCLLWCGAVFAAVQIGLYFASGYDPVVMFRTALRRHHAIMSGMRHDSPAQYVLIASGNLITCFIGCGLVSSALWCRLVRTPFAVLDRPNGEHADTSEFTRVTVVTLAIAAGAPLFTLEVERIWLFLIPLVTIDVAHRLATIEPEPERTRWVCGTAAILGAQTVLMELLLNTYW